ncbi:ParB N-terminal domain-containing protein [uncultured Nocardioides sp.]|mgnify:CR=1 FL=1|uniref:ParB N-terminal domain-containing protein n=1 Tax=uncultured Nocardioides sp. TaxID=198441 RepID=UPI002638DD1E|nr:ParB N-terminal domain-containing protein [uncultured Nocardioides sp.]
MSRRSGLGKGLAALIPDGASGMDRSPGESNKLDKNESRFLDIPLGDIEPNPFQPRQEFGEERMAELTRSVQEGGGLQPVLVREDADGVVVEAFDPQAMITMTDAGDAVCEVANDARARLQGMLAALEGADGGTDGQG